MVDQGPLHKQLTEVMARCGVLRTPKPSKIFKGAKDGAIKVHPHSNIIRPHEGS